MGGCEAPFAQVVVSLVFGLVANSHRGDEMLAAVTDDVLLGLGVALAELVAQGEPAVTKVIVPREQLDLLCPRHHQLHYLVDLPGLLRLAAHISEYHVVRDTGDKLDALARRRLVPHEAHLVRVEEVVAVGDRHLPAASLDPDDLVDHVVPPFLHALLREVQLAVEDPQEAEPFPRQLLHSHINDLVVGEGVVLEVELVYGGRYCHTKRRYCSKT